VEFLQSIHYWHYCSPLVIPVARGEVVMVTVIFSSFFSSPHFCLGSLQLLYLSLIKQNAKKEKIEKDLLPKICTLAFVSALRNGFVRL